MSESGMCPNTPGEAAFYAWMGGCGGYQHETQWAMMHPAYRHRWRQVAEAARAWTGAEKEPPKESVEDQIVKPCPFCGTNPRIERRSLESEKYLYWYVCGNFSCRVGLAHGEWSEKEALEAWNRRVE